VTAPALQSSAADLYAAVAPLSPQDEQLSWPLAQFCGGLGTILQTLEDLTEPLPDGRYGLDRLLDPDLAPTWALPWLGMATGTKLPPSLDEIASREAIKQTPAQDRGTAAAIIGAARRRSLDPVNYPVPFVAPYNGSLYEALLVVYNLSPADLKALGDDLADVQPAWLHITVRNDNGWSVGPFEAAYAGRTIADFQADYATKTVDDFEKHLPSV
jgi:hypothetical protein